MLLSALSVKAAFTHPSAFICKVKVTFVADFFAVGKVFKLEVTSIKNSPVTSMSFVKTEKFGYCSSKMIQAGKSELPFTVKEYV